MTTPVEARPYRPRGDERESDELGEVLEARFQGQTDRLIELTNRYRFSRDDAIAASIASARQSLADTARALRRIAEGRYGACERCGLTIPQRQLREQPHASLCPQCDRSDTTGRPRSGRCQPV